MSALSRALIFQGESVCVVLAVWYMMFVESLRYKSIPKTIDSADDSKSYPEHA